MRLQIITGHSVIIFKKIRIVYLKMKGKRKGFGWEEKNNRIKTVRMLVEKLGKDPNKITQKDFRLNQCGYLYRVTKGVTNALREAGYIVMRKRLPGGYWKNQMTRIKKTIRLVNSLDKKVDRITNEDFNKNKLSGIILETGGAINALKEAGFVIKERCKPPSYWKDKKKRISAVRIMVEALKKQPNQVKYTDFNMFGITSVLKYNQNKVCNALLEAGYNIEPWELGNIPLNYWKNKSNRIRAINWLLQIKNKVPDDLNASDFFNNGMKQLIVQYGGIYKTLCQCGFMVNEKYKPNGYWRSRKRRIVCIRNLVKKLDKVPDEILVRDFHENGLAGMLRYYNDSAICALIDAGFQISSDSIARRKKINGVKVYLSNHGHRFMSIFERDLDDWLWDKGIREHWHDVCYPGSGKNCDIVIGKYWIEAAGLMNYEWYRNKMVEKKEIAKRNGIILIIIRPQDFKDKKVLETKLNEVVRSHGATFNRDLNEYIT